MKKIHFVLPLLFLILAWFFGRHSPPPLLKPSSSASYSSFTTTYNYYYSLLFGNDGGPVHYFYVVFTWAPTFCTINQGGCINDYREDFYLHGIWPKDQHHRNPPINHTIDHGLEEAIKKLEANLRQAWPALSRKGNRYLWRHEWKDHGRRGNMFPEEYFKKGIDVRNSIDLKTYLSSAVPSITPDQTRKYRKSDIENAIKRGRRGRPEDNVYITCKPRENKDYLLYEIYVCLDIEGKYASCTKPFPSGSCLYPPKPRHDEAAFVGAQADANVESTTT